MCVQGAWEVPISGSALICSMPTIDDVILPKLVTHRFNSEMRHIKGLGLLRTKSTSASIEM
jgi:hypothetical protein